jgi:RHS repeat-associated protein
VNRYSYLPFGEPLTHSETVPNPFEYVGQLGVQRDGNDLDYMRARYYTAADGRFINEDPIGVLGGLNLYRYVGNQPTNFIDPTGLVAPVIVALVAALEAIGAGSAVAAGEGTRGCGVRRRGAAAGVRDGMGVGCCGCRRRLSRNRLGIGN